MIAAAALLAAPVAALLAGPAMIGEHVLDFESPMDEDSIQVVRLDESPPPRVEDGALVLTSPQREKRESRVVVFQRALIPGRPAVIEASFTFRTGRGAQGFCFLLTTPATAVTSGLTAWEEPSLPATLGIGFDTYDPPTSHWFDSNGNHYGRTQAQVSVHWDGAELHNAASPVDFTDGKPHRAAVRVEQVAGGAFIDVSIDDEPAHERAFVPGLDYPGGAFGFGARTGNLTIPVTLDDVRVAWPESLDAPTQPVTTMLFEDALFHAESQEAERDVVLPPLPESCERVLLHLRLEAPPGGFDPWDRGGSIGAIDDEGRLVELARFITPFGAGAHWTADVTDLRELLHGERRFRLQVDTWMEEADDPSAQKGWQVDAWIEAFAGTPAPPVLAVVPLWSGRPGWGDPDKPVAEFYQPLDIAVPEGARAARLALNVTGHGMGTNGGAEFLAARRVLTINGTAHEDVLWREDCWLNPLRVQTGTWKFDRAGWCPGEVVPPWEIDLTPFIDAKDLRLEYALPDAYVNDEREEMPAIHWTQGHVVFLAHDHSPTGATP